MPRFDRYGEFFKNYDPSNNTDNYSYEPRPTATKKRKHKKNRYIKLALFLTPYFLGLVSIITVISLTVSFIIKNSQITNGDYMTLASDNTGSVVVEEKVYLFNPVSSENTVILSSQIDSEHAVLIDCSTSSILAQKSANTKIYPASMTKIMAVLVANEHVQNLDDTFKMTSAIIDPLYKKGSTLAGFMPNEEVRIRDMFYGAILESGGEAIVGLAIYVAGSEEAFVKLMNQKATDLGLTNTNFCNVSGLHNSNHYTTCREMAIIMQAALSDEFCRTVISTERYTVPANELRDALNFHSGMFTRMHGNEPEVATVKGGKTGYTAASGNCLVSYAITDDGREIICVTAKGSGKYVPIYDCIELYKNYTH